jgi:hypothetical protein
MIDDRRVRRTDDPRRALSMALASSRRRTGAEVVAVGTCDGRLVAGSGEGALLVAVLGARVAASESAPGLRPATGQRPDALAVSRCGDYVIASVGVAVMDDVTAAVRRILS